MKCIQRMTTVIVLTCIILPSSFVMAQEDDATGDILVNQCAQYADYAQRCESDEDCEVYFGKGCFPCDCYVTYHRDADLTKIDEVRTQLSKHMVCETCIEENLEAICKDKRCSLQTVIEKKDRNMTDNEDTVFCTADAKLCPDGSAVGRVGPDCEFPPCPGEEY